MPGHSLPLEPLKYVPDRMLVFDALLYGTVLFRMLEHIRAALEKSNAKIPATFGRYGTNLDIVTNEHSIFYSQRQQVFSWTRTLQKPPPEQTLGSSLAPSAVLDSRPKASQVKTMLKLADQYVNSSSDEDLKAFFKTEVGTIEFVGTEATAGEGIASSNSGSEAAAEQTEASGRAPDVASDDGDGRDGNGNQKAGGDDNQGGNGGVVAHKEGNAGRQEDMDGELNGSVYCNTPLVSSRLFYEHT